MEHGGLCDTLRVVYDTSCCVRHGVLCGTRGVVWNTACCVGHGVLCGARGVVWDTGCCGCFVGHRVFCGTRGVLWDTGCCVGYEVMCGTPRVVGNCCVEEKCFFNNPHYTTCVFFRKSARLQNYSNNSPPLASIFPVYTYSWIKMLPLVAITHLVSVV